MKHIFLITLLSILPSAAVAEENLNLKYEALWNGIKAGEARVDISEVTDNYTGRVRAESMGLVKNFTNYWTDSKVTGAINGNEYKPSLFEMKFQPKKAPTQRVTVTYGADGSVKEVASPPEKRGKRPEVDQKSKKDLPDPISAALIARDRVREMVKSAASFPQKFALRTFDSRRVTDLNFNVTGYKQMKISGRSQKVLEVIFNRTPITGYNKRELEKMKEINPLISIYVNENFVPVYASGQSIIGEINIRLVKN